MLKRTGLTYLRLYYNKHQRHYAAVVTQLTSRQQTDEDPSLPSAELLEKIQYNTVLEKKQVIYGNRKNFMKQVRDKIESKEEFMRKQMTKPLAFSLKYYTDDKNILGYLNRGNEDKNDHLEQLREGEEEDYTLPYKLHSGKSVINKNETSNQIDNPTKMWLTDYDCYDDSKMRSEETAEDMLRKVSDAEVLEEDGLEGYDYEEVSPQQRLLQEQYGTPDPTAKASNVPCGGCGAILHCRDTAIPGYIPSEIFIATSKMELHQTKCQRCHFLMEYNIALNISVNPEEYPELLKTIRPRRALVILMVDLLDFPCSLWPGIIDIIGTKRPVILVGNKVDLLPQDCRGYLNHIKETLINTVKKCQVGKAQIKHVALISAKTGYGVEELINKLHNLWAYQGDVYILGCTNVGKSSLFNALLQSDFCKTEAMDLLQKATISSWPGTTLNLLKFPVLRPTGWRLFLRTKRLMSERADAYAENKLRKMRLRQTGNSEYATLIGRIGRTYVDVDAENQVSDPYSYQNLSGFTQSDTTKGLDENSKPYQNSRWCFDTPGVVHPDHILTLLTIEEIMLTLPKALIRPRTLYMRQGQTFFLAGLARVDVTETFGPVRINVFASKHLPLTVCCTGDAAELYKKLLGTEYLGVPCGNEERLSKWPEMQSYKEDITMNGLGWEQSTGDVVLSSAGWISVNALKEQTVKLKVWTLEGRGMHVRQPSMIQFACNMKGKRIQGTPAYTIGDIYKDSRE